MRASFIFIHHEAVLLCLLGGMLRAQSDGSLRWDAQSQERWQPQVGRTEPGAMAAHCKPHSMKKAKHGTTREQEPDVTSVANGNKSFFTSTAVNCASDSFAAVCVAVCSLQRNCSLCAREKGHKCARRLCACCCGPGGSQRRKMMCMC